MDDESIGSKTALYEKKALFEQRPTALDKRIPTLLVLRGAETGLRITIAKDRVTLGRTIDADIVLNDKMISRCHAEIVWDPESGSFGVIDLNSTNGTFLNNRPIERSEIQDGDKLFVGSTILKFVLEDQVESESGQLFDKLMFQDDLTGLVVRRRFDNDLRVHLQSARALGRSVSLLMMDMDGLKKVNDSHGHPVGAFVISEVGKIIGGICNELGQACRYGGDEFIAYLLDVDQEEAVAVGQTVRDSVRGHVFKKDGLDLTLSISIGVASFPQSGKDSEEITRAADEALYRAKEKGRDTVSV